MTIVGGVVATPSAIAAAGWIAVMTADGRWGELIPALSAHLRFVPADEVEECVRLERAVLEAGHALIINVDYTRVDETAAQAACALQARCSEALVPNRNDILMLGFSPASWGRVCDRVRRTPSYETYSSLVEELVDRRRLLVEYEEFARETTL